MLTREELIGALLEVIDPKLLRQVSSSGFDRSIAAKKRVAAAKKILGGRGIKITNRTLTNRAKVGNKGKQLSDRFLRSLGAK